jgi:predicted RNase H-like nuclease
LKFVGIDLAWGEQKPSGVAVIESEGKVLKASADLMKNEEICRFASLDSLEQAVIAIDAPLVVQNSDKCRPVEHLLTQIFWPYDAAPFPANLSNPSFKEGGRICKLRNHLKTQGFVQRPVIARQEGQRSFMEVFPSPALVMLFPAQNRLAHIHCSALRYKYKPSREWAEVHSQWEIYRARLRSLQYGEPPLKLAPEVMEQIGIDIPRYRGSKYKQFDDLLDGIFCAYLAYYFWYWGEQGCWVLGDVTTGCVTVPKCRLATCPIESGAPRAEHSIGNL